MKTFKDLISELSYRGYDFEEIEPYEYYHHGVMAAYEYYLRPINKYPNTFNINKDYIATLLMEYEIEIKHYTCMEYVLIPIKSIEQLIEIIDPDLDCSDEPYESDCDNE